MKPVDLKFRIVFKLRLNTHAKRTVRPLFVFELI